MDYSLLLGVHDLDADDDDEDEPQAQDGEDQEEVDVLDEEYESGASGGVALTPPDSPQTDKKSTNLTSDQVWNFCGGHHEKQISNKFWILIHLGFSPSGQ